MAPKPDYVKKKFRPMLDKTLQNALSQRIGQEFPRIGGPRILAACAQMVLEVIEQYMRPRDHLQHGQILWIGVSVEDPPARNKTIANTRLIPVILDLCTKKDIDSILERVSYQQRLQHKSVRLCQQAYQQGALLSNCDLSEILNRPENYISNLLADYERQNQTIVPRRATIHDVGTGLTHKKIICRKRYLEGKETHQIAQETYHSKEAVDHYLGQFDRVRHCRKEGMSPEHTSYILNCSLSLVNEYLKIDGEIQNAH